MTFTSARRSGKEVPLSAVTHYAPKIAPLSVNHQGQFPSVTVSFNLAPGVALSDAAARSTKCNCDMGVPSTIHGMFSGTLQAFQASLSTQPFLIITALMAVYIVLGILYESYIHPITILSTLPSAGCGRGARALAFPHGPQRHCAHRRHPADRNREEKRDHDDRLRAGRRTPGK